MYKHDNIKNFFLHLVATYEFTLNPKNFIIKPCINSLHSKELASIKAKRFLDLVSIIANFEQHTIKDFKKFLLKPDGLGIIVVNGHVPEFKKVEAIFIFIIKVETLPTGIQNIKLFNYISLTRFIFDMFAYKLNIFPSLNKILEGQLQTKSLYFAAKALSHIPAIIPFVKEENQQVLAHTIYPFHKSSKKETNPLTYRKEFKRYINTNKETQFKKVGTLIEQLDKDLDCIPMQKLKCNIFIEIF